MNNIDIELIRKNIRHLRKIHGETLKELADVIHTSESDVSMKETGTRGSGINYDIVARIANHYGVPADALLTSDLSSLEPIDFSVQGMSNIIALWKAILPLQVSEAALKNKDFRKAYDICNSILESFSNDEPATPLDSLELFINAANEGIFEAAANIVWLIFIFWSSIMDENMLLNLQSIIYPREGQKPLVKKVLNYREDISDEVRQKRKAFIEEYDALFFDTVKILKSDIDWTSLGDYYLGLKYLFGMEDSGYSDSMNSFVGMQMLMTQARLGNAFALKILDTFNSL